MSNDNLTCYSCNTTNSLKIYLLKNTSGMNFG